MRPINWYSEHGIQSQDAFQFLMNNLQGTLRTWDYFVDWKKVRSNLNSVIIELNISNSLIGSKDFDNDFVTLVRKYPEVKRAIPILLAVRDDEVAVLENLDEGSFKQTTFDFGSKTMNEQIANDLLDFMNQTKLSLLFTGSEIKNLVDYVFGVEVGLDSNGRKNRGGTKMEEVAELFISKAAAKNPQLLYLKGANSSQIKRRFGMSVHVDKSDRKFDFAVFNKVTKRLFLFETNFYNDTGSKLKSVCGEFKTLNSQLKKQDITFIWITDGKGWEKTARPLREAFDELDYVINLKMLEEGFLDSVLSGKE